MFQAVIIQYNVVPMQGEVELADRMVAEGKMEKGEMVEAVRSALAHLEEAATILRYPHYPIECQCPKCRCQY